MLWTVNALAYVMYFSLVEMLPFRITNYPKEPHSVQFNALRMIEYVDDYE